MLINKFTDVKNKTKHINAEVEVMNVFLQNIFIQRLKMITIFFIFIVVFTSCNRIDNKSMISTGSSETVYSSNSINEITTSKDIEDIQLQTMIDIEEKYPEIAILSRDQETDKQLSKIIIYKQTDPEKKVTITSPSILNYYQDTIRVTRVFNTEWIPSRYDKYIFDFYYGENKVSILVEDDKTFSIEKYHGKYFTTYNKINQLGLAFLEAPSGFPENTILAKMASCVLMSARRRQKDITGNLITTEDLDGRIYFNEMQIISIISTFNKAQKVELSKPNIDLDKIEEKFIFYYFGQKLYMTFYNEHISITEGNYQKWYKLSNEDIRGITYILSLY